MKFFFIALIVLTGSSATAFTLIGSAGNKGFANPKITIEINSAGCPAGLDLRSLVSDAVEAWNGVVTSNLELSVGGDTTNTGASFPPVAYCDSSISGNTLGEGGNTGSASGILTAGFLRLNTNSGSAGYILNQTYDRQVIVSAHELGHMFGLGHTTEGYSLMHYSIGSKTDLGLSQDDIDGITFLYPRDELAGDDMLGGCGSIGPAGGSSGDNSNPPVLWSLFLVCFPVLFAIKLRAQARSPLAEN